MRRHARSAARAGRQAGFSLLEAIVALTIVGLVGTALFTWAASTQSSLSRVREQVAQQDATVNAIEYLKTVNPMLRPEGVQQLGPYELRWRAQPLTPVTDAVDYPAGRGAFKVALYRLEVTIDRDDRPQWHRFEVMQVGYRRDPNFRLVPGLQP